MEGVRGNEPLASLKAVSGDILGCLETVGVLTRLVAGRAASGVELPAVHDRPPPCPSKEALCPRCREGQAQRLLGEGCEGQHGERRARRGCQGAGRAASCRLPFDSSIRGVERVLNGGMTRFDFCFKKISGATLE